MRPGADDDGFHSGISSIHLSLINEQDNLYTSAPARCGHTDGSGMIYRTIGRTIILSQVGFPTINRRPRPDPVPMFVRYPRHRPRSGSSGFIRPMGRDLRGESQENEIK
jgi:hypothetical protein